jgi:uncharacterized protein YeeX (DUF496 family)
MDRNELKIQALLEKISSLVSAYENQVADFRVELTLVSHERDQLQEQLTLAQTDTEQQPDEVVPQISDVVASDSD